MRLLAFDQSPWDGRGQLRLTGYTSTENPVFDKRRLITTSAAGHTTCDAASIPLEGDTLESFPKHLRLWFVWLHWVKIRSVCMKRYFTLAATLALFPGLVIAQTSTNQQTPQQDRLGAIFGALFGDRSGGTSSIDAQWSAGQMPLLRQQTQFQARVDTEVRSGRVDQTTATRLKSDYAALVRLETEYGADRRFSIQERSDLAERYRAVTDTLTAGGYANNEAIVTTVVADGRVEFVRRVDAAVAARRISRTQGTRLKADYSALVQLEVGYLRDGAVSDAERDDLDSRLDALDIRLGDTNFGATPITPRSRLDAIGRALPSSGLSTVAQAQLKVELGDLSRLEAAYAQLNVTADDRAYLNRRLTDLETRARVNR